MSIDLREVYVAKKDVANISKGEHVIISRIDKDGMITAIGEKEQSFMATNKNYSSDFEYTWTTLSNGTIIQLPSGVLGVVSGMSDLDGALEVTYTDNLDEQVYVLPIALLKPENIIKGGMIINSIGDVALIRYIRGNKTFVAYLKNNVPLIITSDSESVFEYGDVDVSAIQEIISNVEQEFDLFETCEDGLFGEYNTKWIFEKFHNFFYHHLNNIVTLDTYLEL